jgi:hypothetical protein
MWRIRSYNPDTCKNSFDTGVSANSGWARAGSTLAAGPSAASTSPPSPDADAVVKDGL